MPVKSMLATLLCVCASFTPAHADEMPWVIVAKDKKSFALEPSGKAFTPWGFNYDHDTQGRLLEDYWDKEWDKVEAHFGQMKTLGANVVRIHLQVGKFMDAADKPNEKALGFQPEARPYSPHVTLARLKSPAPLGVVEQLLEGNKDFNVAAVLLSRFGLYSSVIVDDVPQYREEAEFRLPASST